jgi:DNA adenine methylase
MQILGATGLDGVDYAEAYGGGAAIAISLLIEGYASTISINDLSRPVYSFWHTALNDTERLCRRISRVRVTMDEWYRQRAIYDDQAKADLDDLGFATLFLNRTNRSGILGGGVIGGKEQTGAWSLDARFNKAELVNRIKRISRYRSRIQIYNLDAIDFIDSVAGGMGRNSFLFFDPPYIENGTKLYLNTYRIPNHREIAGRIRALKQPWMVTYDYSAVKHRLYSSHRRIVYGLHYSAQSRYPGKEVLFLSNALRVPDAWMKSRRFLMTPKSAGHPLYGLTPSHWNLRPGR